jgi:ABC-type nitrate/sulfonate/bicarbonate transport system substrate-binding protein
MIRAIKEDANIQMALPPGAITINATGGNAGGPVTVVGTNITSSSGVGLIQ